MSDEKQLTVKTNIIKRMVKEVEHYKAETIENEERIEKMKRDGKDFYDLKKANEVLEETKMMIPDSKRRLDEALDELELLLETVGHKPQVQEAVCFSEAKRYIDHRDTLISK